MNELSWVWIAICNIVAILLLFVTPYVLGGRDEFNKWVRRFLGSGLFSAYITGLSLFLGSFTWWIIPVSALLPIALSFGYGGDSLWEKLLRRGLYGLALGTYGLVMGVLFGHPWLGAIQLLLSIFISVVMGTINPTKAVYEEAIIAFVSVFLIPFMV